MRKIVEIARMRFSQVIDQKRAKTAFLSSVKGGRQPHALILKGGPGIGKLAFGNAIAQYLNCENPSETDSCGKCASCVKISKGIHPDVRFVLPIVNSLPGGKKATTDDFIPEFREKFFPNPYFNYQDWVGLLNAENKQLAIHIKEIRDLKRKLSLKSFEAEYKVVIFWNAEKIKTEAANALLKLLEEPPDKTILILTVTDPTQLLTTINSRCQRIQMHRVGSEEMRDFLVQKHKMDSERAFQVAQLSEGSVSKALALVNQTNKSLSDLYQSWLRTCFEGRYEKILTFAETLSKENKEFQKLYLSFALQKIRDSLLFSFDASQLAVVTEQEKAFQEKFSQFIHLKGIEEISKLIDDSLFYISRNANGQMVFIVLSLRIHSLLSGKVLI